MRFFFTPACIGTAAPSLYLKTTFAALLRIAMIAVLWLSGSTLFAQVNIIDPNAANTPDIAKCFSETQLEATLQFTANGSNAVVSLPMPTGVEYVAGSVMLVSQMGGLSIVQTSAAVANPVFTVSAADGTINIANEIRFKYRVKAYCAATPGTVDFPLNVTFANQTTAGEITADIIQADLNLLSHPIQMASIGTPVTVPIQIQNGGLGSTDNVVFIITESGMTTTGVTVGGFPATLISTVGTVKTYQIPVAALSAGALDNPESITVLRTVVLQSCTFSSSYGTNWGCNALLCQSPTPTAPGEFLLASGAPNLVATSTIISASDLCSNTIIDVTYTNNGTGSVSAAAAFNTIFRFGMNTGTGWSSGNWMTNGITLNGNAVAHTAGMSGTPASVNASQFASDSDGAGGLTDLDGDGRFDELPQGQAVTFRVTLKYTCPTACPAPDDVANLIAGANYSDQCGLASSVETPTVFAFNNTAIGTTEIFHPTTVGDGQKFNVEVCIARNFQGANCADNIFQLNLTLPAGMMATGVGSFNGTAATVTTVGGVAVVSGSFTSGTTCFIMELMYTCPSSPLNFSYEALYTCSAGCACVQKWGCGTFDILGGGCGVCTDGGLTIKALDIQRTTLGFTDRTGVVTVNPATLSMTSLRKGMPCDEFRFTATGTMNGGTGGTAAFDNGFLEISYDQLSSANLLEYVSGMFNYFDASTGITTNNITLPTPTSSVIGGRHVFIFNFNAFIATLPGGLMAISDIVTAMPILRVLNNAGLTATPMRPTNARAVFFNLATAAGNPLPGGDARFTCDFYVPEFYLHNPAVLPIAVSGSRMGCGTYQVTGAINHQLTVQADEYPGEVRPLFRLNNIVVQITNGDSYDPSVTPSLLVYGSADDPAYPVVFNLPAPTIVGNTLTWTNPGTWPLHDLAGSSQSSTGYQLRFNLINSGCANASDAVFRTTWNYNRFGYGPTACQIATSSGALNGTVAGGAPVHTLTNQTGTLYANGRKACFQVKIENTTAGRESRFIWLALEDNLSPMDVVSVRDVATNTLLPLLSYTNGKWVKVAATLAGGSNITLEVCVTYNNCGSNAMTIRQGWDCQAYPTNPTTTTCTTTIITTALNILPRPSAVQGDFIATSPLPATICNDFVFDVRINSSQQGDLLNPRVKITLPTGMTVQGNVLIEYPLNSNNWQNATPVISGQTIFVNLINHTGIDDTLPGTLSANTVAFPNGEDRQSRVRITVRTTCDFFAGDRILFQPFGEAPCGAAATGSGAEFKSPRIRISGADPTYEGTFNISLGTGSSLNGCYTRTINTTVQLADLDMTDGLAASTGQADTIELSLPSVLDFVPGSFVCTTIPVINCPTFVSATILPTGRRVLKFALPPNIPISNGGVVPINFNFKVQPQQNIACTVDDKITGRVIAVYTGIFCATSGLNCPKITALAGEGETPIVLKKRQFTFENPVFACNALGEFNYSLPIRLQNLPLEADSTIRVEIFCLDANGNITGGPVQILTLTGPLAVGSLTTFAGTFGGCDAQNGVRATIPLTTSTGQFQCHCAAVSTDYHSLNKCPSVAVAANDIEICANETVTVTATIMNTTAAGAGVWTTSGTGNFASTTAISTIYTPSTADKTAGVVTLTYTYNDASDPCAAASASVLITIRPLPTVAAAMLTVCATTFGGTTGSFTLSNADNLVDPADVNTVTYHATQANANTGASPLTSPYSAVNNAVVYARVRTAFGCYATSVLTLKVNALPAATNTSLSVCESDPVGSGIGTFNLNNATANVNNTAGVSITYYASLADAQVGINSLTSPFLATNGTLIYARVFNTTTGCYNTSIVTLNVLAKPRAYSGQLQLCPDAFDGSTATFTLSNANAQVTGGVAGLTVSYYFSLTNAQQGVSPLPNTYLSQTADVWVRVQNAAGCFQVDQVQLVVLENPEIEATGTNINCFGSSTGTATVKILGGFLPYTYDWSNDGPENPDNDAATITGLSVGTYTITVTDGNGCTSIDNLTLTQPNAALTATVGIITNVACRGSATGAIELNVSGGTAPYQYNWPAPAPDVEDPTGLPAGTYVVTVTDSKGCTATAMATITQPATVLAATTMVNSNALCTGGNTGSATVTATGGTSPYMYLWSNGQTVATATNLSAGSYTVTVTDVAGCTKIATATITNPAGLLVVIGSSTNVSCSGGNNGQATAAATGGSAPYSFAWSNGQSGPTATNLTAGNYRVTVTDMNGCTAQTSVTILQPTQLILNVAYSANVTCNGAANGIANVIATGGTPAYTYTWPGGFNGHIRNNLAPNTYIVTVTDANSCMATTTLTITQPAVLSASVTTTTPVSCYGGNNGSINLTVTGGTGPFSYNWSGAAPDIEDPLNLVAGAYTVTVSDQNGCTTTAMATITQPAAPLTATISNVMNTACNGAATGSATVTPAGGTPAYSILWSNGQNTSTVTNLSAGSYTVTVTDMNGCTALGTVTIIHPALLSVGITTVTNVACNGLATGSATALASGGTSPYTYAWNTVPMQNVATATNLVAGTYNVTATDQNTCTASNTVTITQPTLLVASIINTTPASCNGGSDGTATAAATGGVTPYTFAWPGGTSAPIKTGLSAGNYVVTVTDANGCMSLATATIGEPAMVVAISINSMTNVLCNGANTGAINVSVTGGTAPYAYNWSGNAPDIEDPFGLLAGSYNLTVTDLNGCTATTTVVISQPATAVSATISNVMNAGCTGVGSGSATVTPAGGTPGYTYLWSNGQTSQTASGLSAGAYQVTVTDLNGCTTITTAVISNPANLSIAVTSVTQVNCSGEMTGSATVLAMGGSPIYNYLWSNLTAGPVLSGVGVGLYSVTVTDANSCTAQTSVTITHPTPLVVSIQSTTRPTCNGINNGTATVTTTGGVGPYAYDWPSGGSNATETGLAPGTYTVTVTDANACTATVTATIPSAPTALTVMLTAQTNISCFGGNNGAINITVNGGSAPYKYDWSGTAQDVEDPAGLVAGTYTVTITDVNGCTTTTAVIITQPATALSSSITAVNNPLCNGSPNGTATVVAMGGTMGYTYNWSNGETTATVTDLAAGSYQVTVRDANGCSSVSIINLVDPAMVTAIISNKTDVSCNGGNNGTATVLAAGGTNTFTYNWENANGVPVGAMATVSGLTAGIYRVTVTDANGCTAATTVTINQPVLLIAWIINTTPVLCVGDANGTALAAATGGVTPYTFAWPGMGTDALRTGLAAGNYIVTVTDANNCTATQTATVGSPALALSVSVSSTTNVLCFGQNSGTIDVTANGGTVPYSYAWSGVAPDVEDPNGLPAGMYTVTVTDLNGCTTTTSATIMQPATPVSATTMVVTQATCMGVQTGEASVTASAGTPGYTYLWDNGQTTQNATGLGAGSYSVTVTDANGCTTVAFVNITNPAGLMAIITDQTNVSCDGGADGTATVTATGGTPPYTYAWSGGTTGTTTRMGLAAENFTVTVTDNNGCTVQTSVTLSQPTELSIVVITTQPTACAGATNGAGHVLATGGTPGYTYTWPGGLSGANQANLSAGNYIVTVTDTKGCIATVTVTISSNGALVITPLPSIGPICPGGTVPSILLAATPFDPNIVFSWSGGAAAGLMDGNSTGFNAHIPAFTATNAEGIYPITITATLQGCISIVSFNITIDDVTPPSFIDCPQGMVMVANDPNVCSAKVNFNQPAAVDECNPNVTVTQTTGLASGSVFPLGTQQIVFTANDGHGNTRTCAFVVVVIDTENPEMTCPTQFLSVPTNTNCTYIVPNDAFNPRNISDNCSVVSLMHNYAAAPSSATLVGATFNTGSTNVTWTVTDAAGHTATCAYTVNVNDETLPTVTAGTCPANITVSNDDNDCGAVITYLAPSFQDNCDGVLLSGTLSSGFASGSVFPIGTTAVQYWYTDLAGNGPVVCTFNVTVNDIQFPVIQCPANTTVETDGTVIGGALTPVGIGPCGVTLSYTAPVGTDNCPSTETDLMSGFGAGANYYVYGGIYTHIWRATDASGNTSTCQFTITLEDPIAPVITCPANTTLNVDPGECDAAVSYSLPLASDNCPGYIVNLINGPASGAEFAIGTTTVEYEVFDDMGNGTTCTFTVTVRDNEKPQITTCPPARTINSSTGVLNNCQGLIPNMLGEIIATDNCTSAVALSASAVQNLIAGSSFGTANGSTQVVTFTVTDAAGNTQTCSTVLTLADNELPTINCAPTVRTINANNNCNYQTLAGEFNPVFADNCNATLTHNYAPGPQNSTLAGAIFPIGNTIVNFTATDANNNTATCAITVQVIDNQNPIFITCPANITVGNDVDKCGANVTFATPIVNDNCGATVTQSVGLLSGALFPVGTTPVTFGAVDAAGNPATCTFSITVMDMQMPKAICTDFTVNLSPIGTATITPTNINGGSSDNCTISPTLAASQTAFDCSNVGLNYVTLSVTDAAGNVNNCVSTVTVKDVTSPLITCPANVTLNSCSSPVPDVASLTTATDACGIATITQNPAAGVLFGQNQGNGLTITLTATDVNGNTSTCVVTVQVIDNQNPIFIACPASTTVSADPGECDAAVTYSIPTAFDNCPGMIVTRTTGFASGEEFPVGTTTVTYVATDAANNTVSCTFNVTVTDNEKPQITTCPPARTINTSTGVLNDCQGLIPNMLVEIIATDNCTNTVALSASAVQNPIAGTAFGTANGSTQIVTFTVTDAAGNTQTCPTLLTLVDDQLPTINCAPTLRTVSSNANCSYQTIAAEFDPVFADNCGATLTHNYAPGPQSGTLAGAIFPVGNTTVNFIVTDANSNTSTCSLTVRVLDNQNPLFINCPANITVNNNAGECGAHILYTAPGSNDNCGAVIVQTVGPVSGSLFPIGTTPITFIATDTSGNPVTCTFTITVNDNEKPQITTCPPARNINTSTGILNDCQGAVPNMLAEIIAADNCTNAIALSASAVQNPITGSAFGIVNGSTQVVTFTVTDAAGNTQTCSTILTLVDDQLPTINCAPTIRTVNTNANCNYQTLAGEFNPVFADNCVATLTHNYAPGPQNNTLAGAIFPLGTNIVNFTATDANSNTATCTITVQVIDNQNPVFINCPANITVGNDVDKCGANVTFATPFVNDNCGATVTQSTGLLSGALFPLGTTPVTFGAVDAAGNPATCIFSITVMDMQMPKAICTDFTVNLTNVGTAAITPANINGGSSDNCTINPTLAASQTAFNCSNVGLNYVTLTVTDAAGNVNNCVSTVTVNDITPPVITCPANVVLNSCSSPVPDVASLTNATDVCGIATITQNPAAGVLFGQNQGNGLTITLTATDVNGLTSTCIVAVQVIDNQNPVFINCPASTTVSADPGECDAAVTYSIPTAADNCPGVVVTRTTGFASGEEFPVGTTTVTYVATDVAGRTASCTFTITVTDNETPIITNCPPNRIITTTTGQGVVPNMVTELMSIDNCTGSVALSGTVTQSPAAGTLFGSINGSEQVVTFTVTDAAGNTQTCSMVLKLADAQAPSISCGPALRTVNAAPGTCGYSVAANEFDAVFTDNLGATLTHNYAPAPQRHTLAGAVFPVGSTTVIFTVTDANGNTATCSVVIVVVDNQSPAFLDCPTTTIIVGNDADKCSAKVNWPIPVADDNCGLLALVQISGPGNGSTINVSPVPFTVVYKATDIYGNTSTCSFQVQVADLQNPQFDADILMPGDITVVCTNIPLPLVGHNPVQGPLTNNDVHDNCTAPQDLVIQFTEVSTQSANPLSCAASTYTITRTWRVIDAAGNVLTHVQVITVQDTQAPNALCKNLTVTLDGNGIATITPADINNGSTDNCAAAANLNYAISTSTFTCANIGLNAVMLTVTDPCGNVSTCIANVTVNAGVAPCASAVEVATSCLDNATNENNGQFIDLITIKALALQTWKLTANTGLFATNSAVPPNAPALLAIGTGFITGTTDGIDNDNDGQTDEADEVIFYTLRGIHVDCQGYNISVSNAGGSGAAAIATTNVIQNKACYPTPVFLDIATQFCLNTPPFAIQMSAGTGVQGTVSNITIDGVAATTFNAAQLGIGFHIISAIFDAGAATTDLVINGLRIHGSPEAALQDPGCRQRISATVQVIGTSSQLACKNLVHVSLGADCMVTLTAHDVIEGNYFCYDDYIVELDKTQPFGNGPWWSPVINSSDIGKTYYYRVVHSQGGNVCWGEINVEDKLAPQLVCPPSRTLVCSQSLDPVFTGNISITDCGTTTTTIDDEFTDLGNCNNPRGVLTRTWIVTDASGNQSSCAQTITITPFHFADLIFPGDVVLDCASTYGNAEAIQPGNTGRPSINGAEIGSGGLCTVSIGYADQYLNICAGDYEIIRTWIVRDACLPLSATNPIEYKQLIKVTDTGAPVFNCPDNITVNTNSDQCCSTVNLPDVIITEGCSSIKNLQAKVTGANPNNGNIITFTVNGTLSDFPNNNYWLPDTLATFGFTLCLPIGSYNVVYTAEDECGNGAICTFQLNVADQTPPIASCQQFTKTALGIDGKSILDASVFNSGTTDNCCVDHFEVRRMNSGCNSGTTFGPTVTFCCADIGDSVLVVFRAYDCHGNFNDCMVNVLVEDKLAPSCIPPTNVMVNCENFDPTLWNYGQVTVVDNCCTDTILISNNYTQFDTVCNRGTIVRTFRVFDCGGQNAQCSQQIVVDYHQDYYIKFPDDKIVTSCHETGNYGEPIFYGRDCEFLAVTFVDNIFTVAEDACYKIERTWKIINWCSYNPNLPRIEIPNPNPGANSNDPANLPGPVVSPIGTPSPWNPTLVKINPTDITATNYGSFWTANANGYDYKQIIKIIDGEPPIAINCPDSLVVFCDSTVNNPQLWQETYYYDPVTQSHNLCEGPTDLTITAFDSCSLSNINIRYLLWLDLDNNGTPETVVNSNQNQTPNTVYFGNAANPNFNGGTPYAFDQRPVPADQKYGFALQTSIVGQNKTARVVWNTQSDPNTYVVPELPYGTHKIQWIMNDGCGNESVCNYTFVVKDCKAPTVACTNGLSINIMPNQMIQLWAIDFLQYAEDNCTPSNQLQMAIRRAGQGTGFPVDATGHPLTNVIFNCDDLGTQPVELWAMDQAGNADYCATYIVIQDNNNNCPQSGTATIAGVLLTEEQEGVETAEVELTGTTMQTKTTNNTGNYAFNSIPFNTDATVTPVKDDNPLNGVTTYDLVLISRHILGLEPLNSPYKMIAADANRSGSITALDIIELRKLILGIYTELPNNTSWRFVDQAFVFPNPANPFQTFFPENKSYAALLGVQLNQNFTGIKIGDINGSVLANALVPTEDRSGNTVLLDVEDRILRSGEECTVRFQATEAIAGFQFTLLLNGLQVVEIMQQEQVSTQNFGLFGTDSLLTVSIHEAQGFTLRFRAAKAGRLSQSLHLSSQITPAEAYNRQGVRQNIALRFQQGSGSSVVTGVGFELYQNEPNPFVEQTTIHFHLPAADAVTLTVLDAHGQQLWVQRGDFGQGYNTMNIGPLPTSTSGVLYYKLETSTASAIRKMIHIR